MICIYIMAYSLTFRPPIEYYTDLCKSLFISYIKKKCDKYIIAEEKGSSIDYTHFQCYIESKVRKDNIKRDIFKAIKSVYKPDKAQKKVCVVINDLKKESDEFYCIGYVMKEDGQKIIGNLDDSYISECVKHYIAVGVKKQSIKKMTKNNIHYYFKDYVEKRGLQTERYTEEYTAEIIGMMGNDGYGMCWVGRRSIYDIVRYLKNYMNGELDEYFKELYSDVKEETEKFLS